MIIEWIDMAASMSMAALINGLWIGVLLAAGAWLLMYLISRWVPVNATTRYIVWGTVLVMCAGLMIWRGLDRPVRTVEQSAERVSLEVASVPDTAEESESAAELEIAVEPLPSGVRLRVNGDIPAEATIVQEPAIGTATYSDAVALSSPVFGLSGRRILFGVWMLLSGFLLLRIAFSLLSVNRLKRLSRPTPIAVQHMLDRIFARLKNPRLVSVALSDEIDSPCAVGFVHPMILLPAGMHETLTPDELTHVLLHEVAHIQRRDDWSMLFQHVLSAVFFFHPGFLIASSLMDRDREFACDDWVVALTNRPKAYATCLAKIVSMHSHHPRYAFTAGFSSGKKQLFDRVRTILNRQGRATFTPSMKLYGVIMGVLMLSILGLLRSAPVMALPDLNPMLDLQEEIQAAPDPQEPSPLDEVAVAEVTVDLEPVLAQSVEPELPAAEPVLALVPDEEVVIVDVPEPATLHLRRLEVQRPAVVTPIESGMNLLPQPRLAVASPVSTDDDGLSKSSMIRLLKSIERIPSSGDKTQVLLTAVPKLMDDPEVLSAYVQAAGTVQSSGDRSRALMGLLKEHRLDARSSIVFLKKVAEIPSSGDKTRVMLAAIDSDGLPLSDTTVSNTFIDVMESISSPGDYKRVATRLLNRND